MQETCRRPPMGRADKWRELPGKDFYPFVRGELKADKLLEEIWGTGK
jgi:hypothetical protein